MSDTPVRENVELKADAKRYQYIRQKLCAGESITFSHIPSILNLAGLASVKPSDIDTAIDAALKEKP